MEYNLLQKTEIWISPLLMNEVNLGVCAQIAANVLSLAPHEVMVTDVLEDTMTLDVLVPTIEAEKIVGREKDLLAALATVPGVQVTAETQVHSQGILGFIALDEEQGKEVLERSRAMTAEISERIRKRSLVFSSGAELLAGQIRDTNTPFLIEALKAEGYNASQGKTLQDDADVIARAFREASETGYGLMVTTGGVGAESKDQTLEALSMVDPDASTPYILKFEKGTGRHHKEGVRIGVGMAGPSLIVCLPGPHDELELAWPVLREGLQEQWGKEALADALASRLRQKFLDRTPHAAHGHPAHG